jgi:hypothetical protein
MAARSLTERIEILERKVEDLQELPGRMATVESHILQLRGDASLVTEIRFSARWRMETEPGQPLVAVRGEERLDPRKIVVRLVQEPESYRKWRALCETMGVAGLPSADQEAVGS